MTAPVISSIVATPTMTSATIAWMTDASATNAVFYGTTTPLVVTAAGTHTISDATFAKSHSLSLTGLSPGTTYYFVVRSMNSGGTTTSTSSSFMTLSSSPTTAPVISAITAAPGVSTSTIAWMTDLPSTSRVLYGTTTPFNASATSTRSLMNSAAVVNHSLMLTSLLASTTYIFEVQSGNAVGTTTSAQFSFKTLQMADTTPPVLSDVMAATMAPHSVVVTWTTNEPAMSKVFYGTTTPLNLTATTTPFVATTTLSTSHSLTVSGLATSTLYHFVVQSKDTAGNTATSADIPITSP